MIGIRYEIPVQISHREKTGKLLGMFEAMEYVLSIHEEGEIHTLFEKLQSPPMYAVAPNSMSFFTQSGELKFQEGLNRLHELCEKHDTRLVRSIWKDIEQSEILYRDSDQIIILK